MVICECLYISSKLKLSPLYHTGQRQRSQLLCIQQMPVAECRETLCMEVLQQQNNSDCTLNIGLYSLQIYNY